MLTKKTKTNSVWANPVLLLMILLTVLVWVGGVVFIYPRVMEALDARAQYESLETELTDVTKKVLMVKKYDNDKQMYLDRIDSVLVKALPREFDIPLVIGASVAVMREFDMEVTGAKSSSALPVTSGIVTSGNVNIEFEGDESNLELFLDKLTKVSPLMRTTQMSYQLSSTDTQPGRVTGELGFSTFALADIPVVSGADVDTMVIPELVPQDQVLYDKVAALEHVTPILDLKFLGDENWDPFQPKMN